MKAARLFVSALAIFCSIFVISPNADAYDLDYMLYISSIFEDNSADTVAPEKIDACIKQDPNNASGYYYRALYKKKNNNLSGFYDDLEQALKKDPTDDRCRLEMALYHFFKSDYEKSIKQCDKGLGLEKSRTGFHVLKAYNYLFMDRKKEANECFASACTTRDSTAQGYMQQAIAWRHQNKSMMALDCINKAIDLETANTTLYVIRTTVFEDLYQKQKAMSDIDRCVAIDSMNPVYHVFRGNTYRKFGLQNEAAVNYLKAIEVAPKYIYGYLELTVLYIETNKYKEAVEIADRVLKIKQTADGYYLRGVAKMKQGQTVSAIDDWMKAGDMDAFIKIRNKY